MSSLKIMLHGDTIQELALQPGQEYFGGRGEGCQIKMDYDKTFSRQHIKITFENGDWIVTFIAKYGSLLIGKDSHTKISLNDYSHFSVPPYEFEYLKNELLESEKNNSIQNSVDENPYLPRLKNNTNVASAAELDSLNVEERTLTVIHTSYKKGFLVQYNEKDLPSKSIPITEPIYYVGRDTDNDIVLDHARVSRRQFKVIKIADKYYILDLGSINGTYLNGNKVSSTEPEPLISGDMITVLDFKISFELRDPEFKQKFKQYQELAPIAPQQNVLAFINPALPPTNYNPNMYDNPMGGMESSANSSDADEGETKSLNFFGFKIPLTSQNKVRLIIGFLALFGLIYGLTNQDSATPIEAKVDDKPVDPFTKLSLEDQNYIKHTYNLTKTLFMKGEYYLAHAEILKLHEKIPKYEDSQDLDKYITLAIEAQKQSELHTKIEKEKQESEEKIQNIVQHCTQLLSNKTTAEELNECLGPALEMNPEHPDIVSLKIQVNKLTEERVIKAKEKEQYNLEVNKLKDQFLEAMKLSELEPLKGIPALDEVMNSTLPDPDKLKEKARKQKINISGNIKNKASKAIEKSKSMADSGNLKDAIMNLEVAYKLDPENDQLTGEIDKYTVELRKKMQLIYQEAIIDENIGNVETAKEKWRKILDQDISNGEYYQKSQIKLKKYGML